MPDTIRQGGEGMDLNDFLARAPEAEKIRLPGRIIIHRNRYSPREIVAMRNSGTYGPVSPDEEVCELEVNGELLARGKFVRKAGEYYFKVTETNKEATT
jgi:hypothetical protein